MRSKKRQGNFDVLKIIAIFLIALHHYAIWSGWKFDPGIHLNKLTAQTLVMGGKLGVNLFVMITGYFMINSKPKIKNLATIWVETTVITLFVYLTTIFFHLDGQVFKPFIFIRRLFPVVFGQYWFVVAYSLLYLSIPMINTVLLSSNLIKIKKGLFTGFIVLSISTYFYLNRGLNFSHPIWLAYVYCIGAYIRLNKDQYSKISSSRNIAYILVTILFSVLINIGLQYLFSKPNLAITQTIDFFGWTETIFYSRDASPLMLILAVLIFILFMNIKFPARKLYSYLSRAAFAVYLLHTAPWFGVNYLLPVIVNADRFYSSSMIFIYGILSMGLISIVSVLIYTCLLPLINLIMRIIEKPIIFLQKFIFE